VAECESRFENVFGMEGNSEKIECGGDFGIDFASCGCFGGTPR